MPAASQPWLLVKSQTARERASGVGTETRGQPVTGQVNDSFDSQVGKRGECTKVVSDEVWAACRLVGLIENDN